jgi:hypothetical protein
LGASIQIEAVDGVPFNLTWRGMLVPILRGGNPTMKNKYVILLCARITESGLSDKRFAEEVVKVHPRTLLRWKREQRPIPKLVKAFLENPQPLIWPTKETS